MMQFDPPACATFSCAPAEICSGAGIDRGALIASHRKVARGKTLFCSGQPFTSLYAVRRGSFKSVIFTRDGREHVTGFQLAGDFVGLDAIAVKHYASDAVALEDAEVCVLPFDRINALAVRFAGHSQDEPT